MLFGDNSSVVRALKDTNVLFAELYVTVTLPVPLDEISLRSCLFDFWGASLLPLSNVVVFIVFIVFIVILIFVVSFCFSGWFFLISSHRLHFRD